MNLIDRQTFSSGFHFYQEDCFFLIEKKGCLHVQTIVFLIAHEKHVLLSKQDMFLALEDSLALA